jgi:uncharacterized protein YbjT (DUF2867 family)
MKYIVTGSLGHISKPLAEKLIAEGHSATVISSKPDKTPQIEALGATAAIGSVEDVGFLIKTFTGADAVYTMVPPTSDAPDWKGFIHQIGKNYAEAIKASGVKKVVNLSSIGAHMPKGCGPVSGIHYVEVELNKLEDVDIVHLRPVYFYYNLLGNIGIIKHMGIIGGNYGDATLPMVHPNDIAAAAAQELLSLNFTGKSIRYIAGGEYKPAEIAKILGAAIGKPDLQWVDFKDEDTLGGMLQAGFSHEVASNYVEMGSAIRSGEMSAEYEKSKPAFSPTKLTDFAKEFAAIYAQS